MATFPQINSPPQAFAEVLLNQALETIQHVATYGKRHSTSSGLTWGYYGGRWGGFTIAAGAFALGASATNYLVVAIATGVQSASTSNTNWLDTPNYARVYKIATTASGLDGEPEDHRGGPGGVGYGGGGGGGGGALTGLAFAASTTTTDSDPGTGILRWNNATQASATILYIDNADSDSTSLATLWASLAAGTLLKITDASDEDVWQLWKVTATPTNGTGYYKFTVSLQVQEGGNIANAASILLDVDSSAVGTSFTGGTLTSAINDAPKVTVASAATTNIGAAASNAVTVSGTTTITAFDTIADGAERDVTFSGILILTHNGTSLILPGSANITTAAGDVARMRSLGSGNWRCTAYNKASGTPVAGSGFTGGTLSTPINEAPTVTLASAATVNIGAAGANNITISGTTTITAFDSIAAGAKRTLQFSGTLTLQYSGAGMILPGGLSIVTAANDHCEMISLGGGNWACLWYQRATGTAVLVGSDASGTDYLATWGAAGRAYANGKFSAAGDAQRIDFVLRASTSTAATPKQLTTDGAAISASNAIYPPSAVSLIFQADVIIKNLSTNATVAFSVRDGVGHHASTGGGGTMDQAPTITQLPAAPSGYAFTAAWGTGASFQDILDFTFTCPGSVTFQCVAYVSIIANKG